MGCSIISNNALREPALLHAHRLTDKVGAVDRLILISPFLKLNDRIKALPSDKNRLKIDVRVIYGKRELQPQWQVVST